MPTDIYIARQPIRDVDGQTFGYELLFRDGPNASAGIVDPNRATQTVIERAYLDWGMERLIGEGFGMINADATLINRGLHRVLPPEGIIIELREDEPFDDETMHALELAQRDGYHFALDNVWSLDQITTSRCLALCSLVKIDFQRTDARTVSAIIAYARSIRESVMVVADKVETAEQFALGDAAGCDLFQGYFIARPIMMSKPARPANAGALHALLDEADMVGVSMERLEHVVGSDPSVSYRVLAAVNSSAFGLEREVESLGHAVALLGVDHLRHLATLLSPAATVNADEGLMETALQRARLMSRLVSRPDSEREAFTVGLLSVTDVLYQTPMSELVAELPLNAEVSAALLERTGELGALLDVAEACERGDTDRIDHLVRGGAERVLEEFRLATLWAHQTRAELVRWSPPLVGDVVANAPPAPVAG
jgi:EAL and modified HD-GYP domain-containing signal transduction protein